MGQDGEDGNVPPVPQVRENWLFATPVAVTLASVYPSKQVYIAESYSDRFAEAESLSLEADGGVGGGGQLVGTLQVGVGDGRVTLPSGLQGTLKVFPRLVTTRPVERKQNITEKMIFDSAKY